MTRIPFLEVSGSNYEMGFQIGKKFRKNIKNVLDGSDVIRNKFSERFSAKCRKLCDRDFPQYVEELKGMAEGAGQTYPDLFLLQIEKEVFNRLLVDRCTTVVFRESGHFILGHNEDGRKEYLKNVYFLRMKTGETSILSFCYTGILPGNAIWINSHGLVCSLTNLHAKLVKPGVPKYVLNRALTESKNLDDFIKIAKMPEKTFGFHAVVISQREGKAFGIETTPYDYEIVDIGDKYFHTNHYIFKKFSDIPQFISRSSISRYKRVYEMVMKGDKGGAETVIKKILSDHKNSPFSICRHGDPSSTGKTSYHTFSGLLVNSSDLEMKASQGNPCNSEWKTYSL